MLQPPPVVLKSSLPALLGRTNFVDSTVVPFHRVSDLKCASALLHSSIAGETKSVISKRTQELKVVYLLTETKGRAN